MSGIKMEIRSTHTLEQILYKNRTILCQIRVQPRKIQYVQGFPAIETSRWLQVEHWVGIDAGLEKILEKCHDLKETDEEQFQVYSSIEVRVRKSNTSVRKLCQYINDKELKEKDVHLALECSIIWLGDKFTSGRPVIGLSHREPVGKNGRKSEVSSPISKHQDGQPRCSSRAPVKSRRLIEERVEPIKHFKPSSSTKPSTSKKLDSPMVSASKNKRKRAQTFEGERSSYGMDKWLGKKKSTVATLLPNSGSCLDGKKNKTSSANRSNGKRKRTQSALTPPPASFVPRRPVYPTIQEMQNQIKRAKLQLEENLKITEYLEKLIPPTPEKVEMWSLNDMSAEEICDTFPKYKAILDDVFRKYCNKSNILNNNGADHFLVMNILEGSKKLEMMNKLKDVYENDEKGTSMYSLLYANAMMPEWIICIFMDRHNFTRDQAMKRMAAQDKYRLYLKEVQSDCSFSSS